MFREHSAIERLREGEPLLGCFLNLCSPIAAYMAGASGYDIALLDQEHSPSGLDNAVACVNALASHDTELWVRVPGLDEHYIKRVLDCGVDGLMCPMINTPEQAHDLVRFCHYPPRGIRGLAPGLGRHTGYGAFKDEYAARVGSALAIMPQIETVEAVENIEEIVAIDGLDIFFLGPFDLSASYGHAGRPDHPIVASAIRKVEEAVRAAGKGLASLAVPNRDANTLLDAGYDLIFGGADLNILKAGFEAQVNNLRSALSARTAAGA